MPGDMAEMLRIAGGDMHCIGAYRAMPDRSCRGGLVIMQEIFGVNAHIRALVEGFAAAGIARSHRRSSTTSKTTWNSTTTAQALPAVAR
jgi:hypothetical protein